jgi:carboxymethylenebutenolidase
MNTNDIHRQPLAALAAVFLLASAVVAEPPRTADKPKVETDVFMSGGGCVAVEYCVPTKAGKYPAMVWLHAVDGIDDTWGPLYRDLATEYAGNGYVVVLVHYFDRTDPDRKDRASYRELFVNHFTRKELPKKDKERMRALFSEWCETVRDAVAYVRSLPEVDGERIGLVGFSLGASLALGAAAEHDLKLACLVELFGALPGDYRAKVKEMPPTLIIHGDADAVVPVDEAYLLAGLLLARKQQPQVEVLAGVEHMFLKDGKDLQRLPLIIAKMKTDAFLKEHLAEKRVAKTASAKPE